MLTTSPCNTPNLTRGRPAELHPVTELGGWCGAGNRRARPALEYSVGARRWRDGRQAAATTGRPLPSAAPACRGSPGPRGSPGGTRGVPGRRRAAAQTGHVSAPLAIAADRSPGAAFARSAMRTVTRPALSKRASSRFWANSGTPAGRSLLSPSRFLGIDPRASSIMAARRQPRPACKECEQASWSAAQSNSLPALTTASLCQNICSSSARLCWEISRTEHENGLAWLTWIHHLAIGMQFLFMAAIHALN